MTPTTKLLSVAAVMVATVCLVFAWNQPPPLPATDEADAPGAGIRIAAGAVEDDGPGGERRLVDATAPAAVDLAHPHAFVLLCRVVDRDGLPVAGAEIAFAPRDCALNRWPEPTAENGTVELQWRGRSSAMTVAVGLIFHGHSQLLREVEVRAGAARDLVLLADHGGGGGFCAAVVATASITCRNCHMGPVLPDVFEARLAVREGLHPATGLSDLLLDSSTGQPDPGPPLPPGEDEEGVEVRVEEESASREAEPLADASTIEGIVVDENGQPIAGTTVFWGVVRDRPRARTETKADGSFRFSGVVPGPVEVRAGGGSPGIARATVEAFAQQTSRCDLQLQTGNRLAGRVLLPGDARAEGWRVEYVAHDESWTDGAWVGLDGSFVIANLPPGDGRLMLWSRLDARLPVLVADSAVVGSTDLRFDLRALGIPAGKLRVHPFAPGSSAPDADVWVWHLESGRGAMVPRQADGWFELVGLAPGFYRVAVSGPGVGWRALGEHWVDGKGTVDLGNVRLDDPAELRIEGLAPDLPLELYVRRADIDLRGAPDFTPRRTLRLPPGRWLALWGSPDDLHSREFVVAGEEEARLDLGSTSR